MPNPEEKYNEYPFKLSGGQRQRVMIAITMACEPNFAIADEPTTALDVTIQAQVLELMKKLQAEKGTSILFITHDLGVVAQMADHVVVMYKGEVVESASAKELFSDLDIRHTKALLNSSPFLEKWLANHVLATVDERVDYLSFSKEVRWITIPFLKSKTSQKSTKSKKDFFSKIDLHSCRKWHLI